MSLLPALRTGALARVNPVTKLGCALLVAFTLLATVDWVSAAVAAVLETAVLAATRLPWRTVLPRLAPLGVAALLAGITTTLYGVPAGRVWWHWGVVEITDGSIAFAVATALRIAAIGVPSVVLFLTIDPTELADGLAQLVRLPARFVIGALAALRLVGLFFDDWRALELARRARGVADRGRVRRWAGLVFALLVLAIRRGSKLATAMEARGFGAPGPRSWARPSTLGRPDAAAAAIGIAIAALAVIVSVATGSWHWVVS
ncbi:energy-coupling factor transporter transmembrane component T family protein [Gryllotalpicola ginsengisoli]|uniref:energy-coupling factor transporter transmembrane component T family protein n=1 Tax=Gryllotalpicola ginsengisoli TaxID=444608 RepID=UPI00042115AE|nr:energy-coupling factor transporter transmembrane component T [Gryllotalpicola ginsengisoli]